MFGFEDSQLKRVICEKNKEHESTVTFIDCIPDQQVYVTGSTDGVVKVWNFKKELIKEIEFHEAVNTVVFMDSSQDLLVGHAGKVTEVKISKFLASA